MMSLKTIQNLGDPFFFRTNKLHFEQNIFDKHIVASTSSYPANWGLKYFKNTIGNKIIVVFFALFFQINLYAQSDLPIGTRPIDGGEATKVLVSFYIIDISEIDNKNQSYTIDVIIRLKWKDPRLSEEYSARSINSIWQPNVQISNIRNVNKILPEVVTVFPDHTVQYTQRYFATLSSPLDFKEFPFDVQTLPITIISFGYSPNEVELVFENAGSEEIYSISDWKIEPIGASNKVYQANFFDNSSEKISRPRMDFELHATRYIQFYLWKVLAPLTVILFLSWAVFWIDPSQAGARLAVSGTSILTLIAFFYKLDNLLPPVSYLTQMDHFIFTSLVLVFIAYLEALVSVTFAQKNKMEIAIKLDNIFRISYPIIFILIIFIFWI